MYLLNDKRIIEYDKREILKITDFDKKFLHPTYYYFRLGRFFKIWDESSMKYTVAELGDETGEDVLEIPPRGYALIQSLEHFRLSEKVTAIFGQISALSRKGLRLNHSPTIDPHFSGFLEMGLENLLPKPREIRFGESIAKVMFYDISDTYPVQDIKGTISELDYKRREDLRGSEPL